jgi:hypothetical protein
VAARSISGRLARRTLTGSERAFQVLPRWGWPHRPAGAYWPSHLPRQRRPSFFNHRWRGLSSRFPGDASSALRCGRTRTRRGPGSALQVRSRR